MEALREVTVWDNVDVQTNHIYLFDGQKAVAYIKFGQGEPFYFSKPMTIDKRGRKFVKADAKLFKVKQASNLIEIKGSKGNSYFVDPDEKTCTCPGFTFRGACKHITEVLK
jgi:SWIM zinc finger